MNEVKLRLISANEPPIVEIDGEVVSLIKLECLYETDTDEFGNNQLYIEYVKKDGSDKRNVRMVGYKDPFSLQTERR